MRQASRFIAFLFLAACLVFDLAVGLLVLAAAWAIQ